MIGEKRKMQQNQINPIPTRLEDERDEVSEMRFENPELESLRVQALQFIKKCEEIQGGKK